LQPGEFDGIRTRLAGLDGGELHAEAFVAAVHVQRPPGVFRQPGGDCALLDRPAARCRLQRTAGLDGLPASCRNFPRSVVRTPDGDEAAFSLACPTAAAIVAAHPAAFGWAPARWPTDAYPPHRVVHDRVQAARGADWNWLEFRDLREAWWQVIAQANSAERLAAALAGMMRNPLRAAPAAPEAVPWDALGAAWSPSQVRAVTEGLARLPDTGVDHRGRQRARWAAWMGPSPARAWIDAAQAWAPLVACHTGLVLQQAFVHDELPVGAAVVRAARLAAALPRALAFAMGDPQAERDALIAVAHLARGDAAALR